jgi:predicted CXXCH cytochrome family protein
MRALIVLMMTLPVLAEAKKAAKPTTAIDPANCVTAECHVNVKSHKMVHAPVAVNSCDACHQTKDVLKHTYSLKREKAELCTFCHEFDVSNVPVVHLPVSKGECIGCHNPHGGVDKRILRENSLQEMCARCHDDVKHSRSVVHEPVKKGECDSCHVSHASRYPKLTFAEGDALCLSCHDKFRNQLEEAAFVHKGLEEGCGKCHEPHAAATPKILRAPANELCASCHEKVVKDAKLVRYQHGVVAKEKDCLRCHTAHSADLPPLLADRPIKLCMSCHKDKQQSGRGEFIAALPELMDNKTVKHGPINDGLCTPCHQAHGSDQPMMLVRSNSDVLYQELAEKNYRLCFGCHDAKLAKEAQTNSATEFRNGSLNLHAIHVDQGQRGRNCRICHSTHASHSPKHVNESVRFGEWEMPIKFAKSENGGTCETGCHERWAYDRERPVARPPTTRPTSRVALTRPVKVATSQPGPVKWNLRNAAGEEMALGDGRGVVILVFAHTSHDQAKLAIDMALAVAVKHPARVVAFIGNDGARAAAKMLRDERPGTFIIADPAGEYFGRLGVHVWPTLVVLRPDGTQAARLAGSTASVQLALAAHADHADGRIDSTELARRLSVNVTAGDTPQRRAERAASAERRKRLDAARVMIEKGAWDEAQTALNRIVSEDATSAEAHYLLGRIHEAHGRWEEAAKAYRAAREGGGQ